MNSSVKNLCDIIIPVWNNLDITRDCIQSINDNTRYPYRIVVIDNASDLKTKQYLNSLKNDLQNQISIITNAKNLGFVKAVNQGLKFSDAKYMCIMNNDTIATSGWLEEMVAIAEMDNLIGMVNPSSNTSCQFPGKMGIHEYAESLNRLKGTYQYLYTCRAFCMILKKEVKDRIGLLDENFGVGYFDDTDYCKRAQGYGYKTVRAKGSYVYHKESQSFAKIKKKDIIFSENEKKFIRKWGLPLRVAYIIDGKSSDYKTVSTYVNRVALMGYQAWLFTAGRVVAKLDTLDHDSIRFFIGNELTLYPWALYKIAKRIKKKKISVIIVNNKKKMNFLKKFSGLLKVEIFHDDEFDLACQKIKELSLVKE